jgi:levoglucosan dehydrogenase
MTKSLKIGVVGAGYIAGVHSAAYVTARGTFPDLPPVELRRVVDVDIERAATLASSWGWSEQASDWRAITRADDVDIVDICTPNDLHVEIALDALDHGKHVICEKPLAADADAARTMAEVARGSDRLAQVCFYYRTWPAIAWAGQLVREGTIGKPLHLRAWMLQDYAAAAHRGLGWRATSHSGGAGALDDLGSHILDIARHLVGEISAVQAMCHTTVDRGPIALIDAASILAEFSSGATGVIEASWAMRGHSCDLGFDLVGDEGAIRFSWEHANELHVQRASRDGFERALLGPAQPGGEAFVGVPGQQMGYRDAFTLGIAAMLTAIATGAREVRPSFDDGAAVAAVVAAAKRSSDDRARVVI